MPRHCLPRNLPFTVVVQNPTPTVDNLGPGEWSIFSYVAGTTPPSIPFANGRQDQQRREPSARLKPRPTSCDVSISKLRHRQRHRDRHGHDAISWWGTYTLSPARRSSGGISAISKVTFTVKQTAARRPVSVNTGRARSGSETRPSRAAATSRLSAPSPRRAAPAPATVKDTSVKFFGLRDLLQPAPPPRAKIYTVAATRSTATISTA